MDEYVIGLAPAPGVAEPHDTAVAASPAPALVGRVHWMLTDHLHIEAPTADADIIDNGALDSFAMVELLVAVEEHFGVEVDVEDLDVDDLRSARAIATLITAQAH